MEQTTFHKQKLYALIAAGVALVGLLLPWLSFFGRSWNGLRGWGILTLFGVIAVAGLAFSGDKRSDYTADTRKYTLIGFGAIVLGAILFWIRKDHLMAEGMASFDTGTGLWLSLIAGLAGLALIYGLVKLDNKKP
jgi:hypothetical protein